MGQEVQQEVLLGLLLWCEKGGGIATSHRKCLRCLAFCIVVCAFMVLYVCMCLCFGMCVCVCVCFVCSGVGVYGGGGGITEW